MKAGWQIKTLKECCSIARGGSPRPIQDFITTETDGINWIKISDATASDRFIYGTKEKIKPSGVARSRLVKDGDFILSNSMSFGRPYIMRTSGCIHDGWLVLADYEKNFDQAFLYYLLGSPVVFNQFNILAAGSTVRNLNIELASRVVLPVPPLPEQKRIVSILDQAFESIARATNNAEKNRANARDLFESYLYSVFTKTGEGWKTKSLGEVCDYENGDRGVNYPSKSVQTSSGVPFINAGHLTDDGIDFSTMNYIPRNRFDLLGAGKIRAGDILFCLRGSLGKCASVENLTEGAIASSLVILRPDDSVLNNFVLAYLRSHLCAEMIEKYRGGAAQPNLSAHSLKQFAIAVPPIDEQKSIMAKLDDLSSETRKLESIYKQKLEALNELKKSILNKAFTGQLN
jgi:type I restriction enzyme S subunit